ncbi:MAG TPA: methyltransferase domain-containing protein [Burkholderiaceae bacterium]|nr:methyltransferase domain-containing protein [Burkholderiaceae bacterium]
MTRLDSRGDAENRKVLSLQLGLLGDTAARDYSRKLRLFNAFAAPELRQAVRCLVLRPGMNVLDAGCGSGEALEWLADEVGEGGLVVGVDLSSAHIEAARPVASARAQLLQADLRTLPLRPASFDGVWGVNTINHFHDPMEVVSRLKALLRPGGRIAIGQTGFLPDMVFAWDARLERLTHEAVRRYYRERYGVDERALAAVRANAGLLRGVGLSDVLVRTFVIERLSPLGPQEHDYLLEAIFRGTWGERLRPYLEPQDYEELGRLCDPHHAQFALTRPDFHFIQTFTVATGRLL